MKPKPHLALVLFAALVGLAVRLGPALAADFPLNDGGLFYAMIRALQQNAYALPAFAAYNGAQIPFAYPPLGFYLSGLLADLTRADLLEVMRLLPALVSALTVPAFYRLARGFVSPTTAAFATLLFALLPRAFAWHIMGGGVTRALGFLFAILTLDAAHRLFTAPSRRLLFWTSVCSALTVLTHPEAATQTAFAALLLYLFFDRSRAGLLRALAVALASLALTSPWWAVILSNHGLDPFLAVSSAVRADSVPLVVRLFLLFQFQFTEEPFLPIIAVLGVIGLFLHLSKRERFLPSWLALAFLVEPRSAPLYMTLPLSILAATALTDLILPRLASLANNAEPSLEELLNGRLAKIFFGLLFVYASMGAYFTSNKVATQISLTVYDREAMDWAREDTPADSVFLVLTKANPLMDAASDWFPVLTDRVSAATVFGYEWVDDGRFGQRMDAYDSLQACMSQDATCLEGWSASNGIAFTHVMIRNYQNGTYLPSILQIHLDSDNSYVLVYDTPEILIYEQRAP